MLLKISKTEMDEDFNGLYPCSVHKDASCKECGDIWAYGTNIEELEYFEKDDGIFYVTVCYKDIFLKIDNKLLFYGKYKSPILMVKVLNKEKIFWTSAHYFESL